MKVTILGAGTMGASIAQLAATAGDDVVVRDIGAEQLQRGRDAAQRSLARFVKAGRLSDDEAAAALGRIAFTTEVAQAVDGADVVIESITEVRALKEELLSEVAERAPAGALLGTNTSQLSITSLAASMGDQAHRLVGIHFFNPPVMMRLVEVIAGLLTPPEVVERAKAFGEHVGRQVVVCRKDSPGFITSRAYAILRLECMRMLEEGVATPEDIDTAMKLGFNFPMGPLELGDMNGLDTFLNALNGLSDAYGDRFQPTVGLKNMVAAGRIGRKAGGGFYDYDADGRRAQ
ncbi:3-hydroxyacyl-CoA dehydrogenase family protein [Conexibacter sp. CPCC 206217]|uniref:3-hydroxyacyl-CoA dehydrogenase family protein n=1 Tax=Conexibacter sp. CPCC 206217 TaxID=3064574 RepID=UPI002722D545|nr:3-hydroxyacyl-CoA dehydrogenase family protein [Conexibacter sp. CPCC 206217]MDO8212581.1 3-hydroxyacyl-CoA dehydrogenase family protein [Conexibacter sp. CPCC 206217]